MTSGLLCHADRVPGLWGRIARVRGGRAEGIGHRQQAHGDPDRTGQP